MLVYLKVDLGTLVTSCHFALSCWYPLKRERLLCNSPTCTDCLITWHSCWDLVLLVAVTSSLLACLLVQIIFHLDSGFLVRLKNGSCPFYVWTRKPFLIWFLVLLIIGFWPFLIQGIGPSWYLRVLGATTWCIYWASLVVESLGKLCYEHSWHLDL